jgi:hypothetical protein
MKVKMMILALLGMLVLAGCDDVEDIVSEEELQQALQALVEADEAFSLDGLSDEGLSDDEYDYEASLSKDLVLDKGRIDTLRPGLFSGIRWGRTITDRSWELTFDELGEDAAFATITGTVSGTLRVGGWVRANDSTIVMEDTLTKPFTLTTTRRVRFARIGDTGDPFDDWRVDGLTALLGTAGDKVAVESISFSLSDTGETYFSLERDDVLSLFFNRENLPTFRPLLPAKMQVTISNTGPEFPLVTGEKVVFRRVGHHMTGWRFSHRRQLNDLGLGVDETAGDNVYSGLWHPRSQPAHSRPYRAFIEVLDLASLFVEEEPFHTEFIGLPYRVIDDTQRRPF